MNDKDGKVYWKYIVKYAANGDVISWTPVHENPTTPKQEMDAWILAGEIIDRVKDLGN